MRTLRSTGKTGFVWIACLVLVILSACTASTVTANTASSRYTGISTAPIPVDEDLRFVSKGVSMAIADLPASGASNGDEVSMGNGDAEVANTSLTLGDYIYKTELAVAVDGVAANKEYAAELLVDGVSYGRLYFEQSSDSAVGDSIELTWDVGDSLQTQFYCVEVVPQ